MTLSLQKQKIGHFFYNCFLFCKKAASGATRAIATYSSASQTCNLVRLPKEGSKCTKQSDCSDLSLNCDTKTKTCKREFYAACLQTSDCLTSLTCINQQCDCVRDKITKLHS